MQIIDFSIILIKFGFALTKLNKQTIYSLAVTIEDGDFFTLTAGYLVRCSDTFLLLLSFPSFSFTFAIRKPPLIIFCCHSVDRIIASMCTV